MKCQAYRKSVVLSKEIYRGKDNKIYYAQMLLVKSKGKSGGVLEISFISPQTKKKALVVEIHL